MNKKLLFGFMSLAALAACTNDDFDSKKVAEVASPVQIEIVNDALTRASMEGDKVKFSANDNDLFTLYHGASTSPYTSGYENATYKAENGSEGTTRLSTPSMIKEGMAVMVYPADTTFRIKPTNDITIKIPAEQTNIVKTLPYMSDLFSIGAFTKGTLSDNTAGKDRKYKVFMRPMASQLTINADYNGTDDKIATLYDGGLEGLTGDEAIQEIKVNSIELLTKVGGSTLFTTEIPVAFSGTGTNWSSVSYQTWSSVTTFNVNNIATSGEQVAKLTASDKCLLEGNKGAKFLILPQAEMTTAGSGVEEAGVVVNTQYGKVIVANPIDITESKYTADEIKTAWYRWQPLETVTTDGEIVNTSVTKTSGSYTLYKTTANIEMGMKQTLNALSEAVKTTASSTVYNEPIGGVADRNVVVNLEHLDMSDLHITTDKQLRDAARVWKKLGLETVTVSLDGNTNKEFKMSQKTIEVINNINASAGTGKKFWVKPCNIPSELCNTIVITGSNYKQEIQDLDFIWRNTSPNLYAKVALANEGDTNPWKWTGDVKVAEKSSANMIASITNRGTMENAETTTLRTIKSGSTTVINVPFVNDGTWNITGGTLKVQFDVTNNGTVKISKGAEYSQDGTGHTFTNEAEAIPTRFTYGNGDDTKIGKVINEGNFLVINSAKIINYGLIEHNDKDAKTFITSNQTSGVDFTKEFSNSTTTPNKMGTINLPYENRNEDNISISAAADQGFVSVTVSSPEITDLNADVVGKYVNYINVNGSVETISKLPAQVKYLEINQKGKEVVWAVTEATKYDGLMILSPVNISLGTTIASTVTYLGASMYVAGNFNKAALNIDTDGDGTADFTPIATVWKGYFGNTTTNMDDYKYFGE